MTTSRNAAVSAAVLPQGTTEPPSSLTLDDFIPRLRLTVSWLSPAAELSTTSFLFGAWLNVHRLQ